MEDFQLLADAIARAWPDDPAEVSPEVAAIEPELLDGLRALDGAVGAAVALPETRLLALLDSVPRFRDRVDRERDFLFYTLFERGAQVDEGLRRIRHSQVEIGYVTDRAPTGARVAERRYGGQRASDLSYGVARVGIPDDHRMGRLPRPRSWRLWFRPDRESHLELDGTTGLTDVLTRLGTRAPGPDLLVFVHGYNVGFADAVRRTAQLAYDLNFTGVPLLYSWPSVAETLSYFVDGENAAASQRHFRTFLRVVAGEAGDGRVHVVAHSMGNRILSEALTAVDSCRLGHVVFAAPDVDAGVFADRVAGFTGTAERYTLYTSARDRALAAAQRFVRHPRAGQAGPGMVVVKGVDTVDATDLDTDFLSHSYVLEHRSVVADLYALITHGRPPEERFGLVPMMAPNGPYWKFRR
ncbi:alpha/beta hydrolase [Plantactinospora sp. B5E13]|uniref:alpha/beta hydrolase n=1 Tax=Plantactinospora sp. B5E13 TaxID=3153758 RepID=UPI00325CB2BC